MKLKKAALTAVCAGALVVGSVAATMAYLTDDDSVVNTFTVGKVQIHLDEADVDGSENTCEICAESGRDHANAYTGENKLVPGCTYDKDPTVTVLAGSEESYVRMFVEVDGMTELQSVFADESYYGADDVFLIQKLTPTWNSNAWKCVGYDAEKGYEFRYVSVVDGFDANGGEAAEELPALFETIKVPGDDVTSENIAALENVEITVTAEAIQAAGFADADAAWRAW